MLKHVNKDFTVITVLVTLSNRIIIMVEYITKSNSVTIASSAIIF